MHRSVTGISVLMVAGTLTLACQGNVDGRRGSDSNGKQPPDNAGTGGTGVKPGDKPDERPTPPPAASAGVAPLRRLTAVQYRNTVRDLLGIEDPVPTSALPADEVIGDRFFSNVLTPLKGIDLDKYASAAQALAGKALSNLPALLPCDPKATPEASCAQKFIESFGKRAYRRPLTTVEIDRLKVVYAAGGDFPSGIAQVIEALLQSPKFLYLHEPLPRTPGKVVGV